MMITNNLPILNKCMFKLVILNPKNLLQVKIIKGKQFILLLLILLFYKMETQGEMVPHSKFILAF